MLFRTAKISNTSYNSSIHIKFFFQVNLSRNQAAVLEKEVNKAEISIKNNIADISEIKWQLQNIPPNEPIYVRNLFFSHESIQCWIFL